MDDVYGSSGTLRRTDVRQLPLDYPECRLHGSFWRGATLGHLEALPGEQEFNADGFMPSLLHKGDTCFTDVVIGRVEVIQLFGNPPHQIRGQRHVLALNV
jgi:hypothetical protein